MKNFFYRNIFFISALLFALASPAIAQFVAGPLQNGIPSGPSVFGQASPLDGLYFAVGRVGVSGHLEAGNRTNMTPALSGCGTTPTLTPNSTDSGGTVTMGTTATGCVITFGTAYAQAPSCIVTWRATPLASQSYVTSASSITTTQTSTSNNLLDYVCVAKSGG